MLLNNCFRIYFGGMVEGSAHAPLPGQWDAYRQFQKFIEPDGASAILDTVANPPGHYLPGVYHPPIIAGELAMRTDGDGDLTAGLIPTRTMALDLTGVGDLAATAALVVSMIAALAGSGSMTASILGRLDASIDLTGSGDLDASLGAIADMVIDMLGAGDLDATIAAYGNMAIDITVSGAGLTTSNVAQAVWGAIASANNDSGTMGAKLNSAASGGVDLNALAEAVWTYATRGLTESALTTEQATQLLEIFRLHGLEIGSPLVVTATSREVADITQTINDDGVGTVTVTRS